MRLPIDEKLVGLSREYHSLGFPGCWASVGFVSWYWDNCPMACAGQRCGKEKQPNVRMEELSDDYLSVVSGGANSARQELGMADRFSTSPAFSTAVTGKWPKLTTSIDNDRFTLTCFHLLCDGA